MRTLELLLFACTLGLLLVIWRRCARRPRMPQIMAILTVVILGLHLAIEGPRWQMWSLYLLAAVLLILALVRRPSQPWLRRGLAIAGLLVWLVTLALSTALPVPRLPDLTGPYEVGTLTLAAVDAARSDPYSDNPDDARAYLLQIWYPAERPPGARPVPYLSEAKRVTPVLATRFGFPDFFLQHLQFAKAHAFAEAPASDLGSPFPVIIFSPGWNGLRTQNTYLAEELASHGYVVTGLDHPYDGIITIFPDGTEILNDAQKVFPETEAVEAAGGRLLAVRAGDVLHALGELERLNADPSGPLFGRLDLDRIGMSGHSTGGATAIQACGQERRCQAILGLDSWLEALAPEVQERATERPIMLINGPEWYSPPNQALGQALYAFWRSKAYLLTLEGASHYNFTDIPLISPLTSALGLTGAIDGRQGLTIVSDYSLAFFEQQLRNRPSDLLRNPGPYEAVSFEENTP